MTEATSSPGAARRPTRPSSGQLLVNRIRLVCALTLSAVVFWYFGWWVARPADPHGAVALLMVEQGVVTMAELLGLAVVVSGLAVAICGAGSAERGPLAVAVGLATLGYRGAGMDQLVLHRLTSLDDEALRTDPSQVFPVFGFVAETWLWLALIGVGFVVGRWVESWFAPARSEGTVRPVDHAVDIRQGVGTVTVACVVAWFTVLYAAGSGAEPLLKGQLYFALICAFLLASLVAHWFFQMGTRVWALVSVAIVAMGAYVYGAPDAETIQEAAKVRSYINLEPMARSLPLEYAALGGIGVLFETDIMAFLCALFGLQPADREQKGAQRATDVSPAGG